MSNFLTYLLVAVLAVYSEFGSNGVSFQSTHVRIAFYIGGGTSPNSEHGHQFYVALHEASVSAFGSQGFIITNVTESGIQGLSRTDFEIVVFPGGSGKGQADAIGTKGIQALRTFNAAGGGYIGTCGGAFLGLQHVMFYGKPPPPTQEPWDRGHGDAQVEFQPEGLIDLHLNYTKNITVVYWQGPIVKTNDFPSNVKIFAIFRTEIHSKHTNETKGEMINTPAITALDGPKGAGRVILNSPHPEIPTADGMTYPEIYAGELEYIREKQTRHRKIM